MSTSAFEADTIKILHTIPDEVTGSAKDLTGATVLAIIDQPDGETFDGGATVPDATAGQISLEFSPDTFDAKTYPYQIRVTDAVGDVQTVVASSITAKRSLRLFAPDVVLTTSTWADAIKALPGFHLTVDAGLAATSDGDYFGVATQDATQIELWRNDDGIAAAVRMTVEVLE